MKLHRDFGDFQPFLQKHEQFESAIREMTNFIKNKVVGFGFFAKFKKRRAKLLF